jgi:integrase
MARAHPIIDECLTVPRRIPFIDIRRAELQLQSGRDAVSSFQRVIFSILAVLMEVDESWSYNQVLVSNERNVTLLRDVDKPLVESFKVRRIEGIKKRKHSRGGGGTVLDAAILHRVFSFAVENDMVVKNPVRMEGRPGDNPEGGAEPYSAKELGKLRENAGDDLRSFPLLRWTGLRGSDAVTVPFEDFYFDRKEMDTITRKRRKQVIVPLHPELLFALETEIELRKPKPGDPVLPNPETGTTLTRPRLYERMKALGKRAGVSNCRPHRFRDTMAVDMLARGASPVT